MMAKLRLSLRTIFHKLPVGNPGYLIPQYNLLPAYTPFDAIHSTISPGIGRDMNSSLSTFSK
jgi:hypothetical protein